MYTNLSQVYNDLLIFRITNKFKLCSRIWVVLIKEIGSTTKQLGQIRIPTRPGPFRLIWPTFSRSDSETDFPELQLFFRLLTKFNFIFHFFYQRIIKLILIIKNKLQISLERVNEHDEREPEAPFYIKFPRRKRSGIYIHVFVYLH